MAIGGDSHFYPTTKEAALEIHGRDSQKKFQLIQFVRRLIRPENSFDRVPEFLVPGLERPQVGIDSHLEFAAAISRYSPRVPAGTASPIFECASGERLAGLIDYSKSRWRLPPPILLGATGILFARLAFDDETD